MIAQRTTFMSGFALASLGTLALVCLCIGAKLTLQAGLGWRCPIMALFHLPCPSCGSTRAFAALSEMRFLDAFRFNPLLVSAIPLGAAAFLVRDFLQCYARFGWSLLVGLVLANWVYLYLFLPR